MEKLTDTVDSIGNIGTSDSQVLQTTNNTVVLGGIISRKKSTIESR
jgi:hypothetical protein